LVAAEWRFDRIEEISRIKRTVADVLECVAMEIRGSGTRRSPNDSPGGPAKLRRIIAGKNRKLFDSVGP
jgi:hypothetical protein